jgi:hypothetical protein
LAQPMRGGGLARSIQSGSNKEGGISRMTCDYNGWNDAPEEEREGIDEYPVVWTPLSRFTEIRPIRATRRSEVRRFLGGMAA